MAGESVAAPAPGTATAAPGAPASRGGWSATEVGSLVTTGILVIVIWLWFRRMKFPE